MRSPDWAAGQLEGNIKAPKGNLCGLEPQLIKLEFIIYLPKLKVSMGARLGPYFEGALQKSIINTKR